MSQFYTPRRTSNLYNPKSPEPFKISRSKIDLYIECPRCFYFDRRLGVSRPSGPPWALNAAVDKLLKKEFDILRQNSQPHPVMKKYGLDAVPVRHEKLDEWRENFKGVQYLHEPTNIIVAGAIDDLWQNTAGEYIVVDYKSTSKDEEITELNQQWHDSYKRQIEVYQWLLRRNGLKVSDTGYFVYCNGRTDISKFDGKLEFDITLIAYQGSDSWVEDKIKEIYLCLKQDKIPEPALDCDFCRYREAIDSVSKGYIEA